MRRVKAGGIGATIQSDLPAVQLRGFLLAAMPDGRCVTYASAVLRAASVAPLGAAPSHAFPHRQMGAGFVVALPVRPYREAVKLRCLIVDDNPEFLEAASRLLEQQGISVVGVAESGVDASRLAGEVKPDVTLVDIDLGGEDGLELARRLIDDKGTGAGNVILISTHDEDEFIDLIEASPAIGFVPKSALSADAIRRLAMAAGDS